VSLWRSGDTEGGDVSKRGFFAVGIEHGKNVLNHGTLWRSAQSFGAAYIFTVRRRFERQASDTRKAWRHLPVFHYGTLEDLMKHLPYDCLLVGVELDERAKSIQGYCHPERAVYLLGAEDHGLTAEARSRCHHLVQLPGLYSLNVATAGSIVMFDRLLKES
jgi:tRNA G18 (ribose-2'-O)-methylase SpoU